MRQLRYSGLASKRHAPIDSFSRFRGGRDDRGDREGGAAEAAHFLFGFCTGGLKDQMSHSLQVEVIPRPPAGEAPERSEGEGGGLSRMSKLAQKISCVTYFPESFVR